MRNAKLPTRVIGRRGLRYSLGLCMLILALGGLGFWLLEPRAPTYSDGLWLAFTTAATVGYGDIVPSTHASRVFAVLVVLMGLAVLSLVTASVAAMLVEAEERAVDLELLRALHAIRQDMLDMRHDMQALRDAVGQEKADTP
ncbi:MAG: potassium channel family protein [Rhodoferax sp.]|nr:potassium channel family protein [Rhodoferax sp.]